MRDPEDDSAIRLDSLQLEGPQSAFCLDFHQDRTISAVACTRVEGFNKFSFYPYILLVSAFFLLLTVAVYTAYPKLLYNNTQRLRRHFAANMLLAFVILSVNQFTVLREASVPLCVASAHLQQFFFLAAFSFMTIICVDTAVAASALRVSDSSRKHKRNVAVGYGVPLAVSALTVLAELSLSRVEIQLHKRWSKFRITKPFG